jgi:hypothetical protein
MSPENHHHNPSFGDFTGDDEGGFLFDLYALTSTTLTQQEIQES